MNIKKLKLLFLSIIFVLCIIALILFWNSRSKSHENTDETYGTIEQKLGTEEVKGNGYNYIIDGNCFKNKDIPSKGISGFNYKANALLQEQDIYNQKLFPKEIKKDNQYITFKLFVGESSSYVDVKYNIETLKMDMFYVP